MRPSAPMVSRQKTPRIHERNPSHAAKAGLETSGKATGSFILIHQKPCRLESKRLDVRFNLNSVFLIPEGFDATLDLHGLRVLVAMPAVTTHGSFPATATWVTDVPTPSRRASRVVGRAGLAVLRVPTPEAQLVPPPPVSYRSTQWMNSGELI